MRAHSHRPVVKVKAKLQVQTLASRPSESSKSHSPGTMKAKENAMMTQDRARKAASKRFIGGGQKNVALT